MEVDGKSFLIAGGASGLGRATAEAIVGAGGSVVIADRDRERGEDAAETLGEQCVFVETDVTDEVQVAASVATAERLASGLHGVVNCAGLGIANLVLKRGEPHPLDLFRRVIDVNLIGTFNVARLAARSMAQPESQNGSTRGVIVNTASVAAFDGQIGQAAYSASKGGIAALTLPLARELARYGIRVVAIAPGIFDTPMLMGLSAEARASLEQQVPFPPRLGRPDEFASLVLHIFANEMINGEVVRLDGAIRMAPR
jgi:NAD(P)-dependent dehydrogenase (short-subunit alcohol dehydrogenase family)